MPRFPIYMAAISLIAVPALAATEEMTPRPTAQNSRVGRSAPDMAGPDSCGQRDALRLVGTMVTPQSRIGLSRSVGHDRIRVIRPGTVITQELRNDRLNLIVDETGRLLTARCG